MKKDNHNTVDVNVGAFLRQWIVNTYGTDIIRVDKDSNIWYMIKQHLETLPEDYSPLPSRDEYISFVLLTDRSRTTAYAEPTEKHPDRKSYRVNTLYRCSISKRGEYIIRRFLTKQFKNAFHNYMRGALNNNPELSITEAITEFLLDACQADLSKKVISTLCKDWYRYRKKYPDEFKIPIFF